VTHGARGGDVRGRGPSSREPAPQAGALSQAPAPVAEVRGLLVRYAGAAKPALEDISFSVPRGSVHALLGRNGAGKSSLIRCLLGQQKPAAGTCLLFGEDAWARRADLMSRVGVVPEDPDAPASMTARQLSTFCSRLYPTWDAPSVESRLARFGASATTPFGRLSRGQRALVSLALALASAPEILVLDDPTLGLDPVARRAFFEELVGDLADRGTSVLLATHDLDGVERIATHVGILRGGTLLLAEELERLKGRFRRITYANERTEERSEYGNELDGFDAVRVKVRGWGVEALVSNFDDGAFERFRATEGVVDAEAAPLSLEEIFVVLAGDERRAPGGRP